MKNAFLMKLQTFENFATKINITRSTCARLQKQSFADILKNFAKFNRKRLVLETLFQALNFIRKRL